MQTWPHGGFRLLSPLAAFSLDYGNAAVTGHCQLRLWCGHGVLDRFMQAHLAYLAEFQPSARQTGQLYLQQTPAMELSDMKWVNDEMMLSALHTFMQGQ